MKKILLVDDAAFMRLSHKNTLKDIEDITFYEAGTGKEAVDMFPSVNPDLVIMDITMPEMDGIEALKAIKKINPAVKVLMCSAMGQQLKVAEAITSGASDFVVKPFDSEVFVEKVTKLLGL